LGYLNRKNIDCTTGDLDKIEKQHLRILGKKGSEIWTPRRVCTSMDAWCQEVHLFDRHDLPGLCTRTTYV